MELKRLSLAALLAWTTVANAQQTQSTVNPLIPQAGTPVEQSGGALRQNFLAAQNDLNALFARSGSSSGSNTGFGPRFPAGTPDSTLEINANTSQTVAPFATTVLHVVGADNTNPRVILDAFAGVPLFQTRYSSGGIGALGAPAAGQQIGQFGSTAWDGTAYSTINGGHLDFRANELWTSAHHGTYASMFITLPNSTTGLENMRWWSDGGVTIFGHGVDPGQGNLLISGTISTAAFNPPASFTGSITGTALTVSGVSGTIAAGQTVYCTGCALGTVIVSGSGTTWVVSPTQGPFGPVAMSSIQQYHSFVNNTSGGFASVATSFGQTLIGESVTATTNFVNGMSFTQSVFGGNGGRTLVQVNLQLSGWLATGGNQYAAALLPQITATANAGGPNAGAPAGAVFALNPFNALTAGATFYAESTVVEVDSAIATSAGNAPKYVSGVKIVQKANNAANGQTQTGALVFTNEAGAIGWPNIILIGGFAAAATPFGASPNGASILALAGNPAFKFGIDLSAAAPSGTDLSGGFPFRSGQSGSTNFSVNWSGGILATLPASAGAGGLFVCVDTAGVFYKKATCP